MFKGFDQMAYLQVSKSTFQSTSESVMLNQDQGLDYQINGRVVIVGGWKMF